MAAIKYSRQREAIKQFLANRTDHPTADVIYTGLRADYPNISLGTVYRNLSLLEELGELIRISAGDGMEHYDGNTSPHQHFACSCCHKVYDVWADNTDSIIHASSPYCPGTIESCSIIFHGICEECNSSAKGTH